jgi:glucosamine--fructose-6-phosphate aminotransferase (isomerizing)
MEYRGYDSAGICLGAPGGLALIKTAGKVKALAEKVPADLEGNCGIGHTRWATHGLVNEQNAHPHTDIQKRFALVHNGIIENYLSLKQELQAEGFVFQSETDSEVLVALLTGLYRGDLEKAVKEALGRVEGTYGLACLCIDEPGLIVGARNGSPLVVGIGDGEMFLASDYNAMIAHTRQVVYCEDGEVITLTASGFRTTDLANRRIEKSIDHIDGTGAEAEKAGFPTFMEKEICEQPESVDRAMRGRLSRETGSAVLGGLNMSARELRSVGRIRILSAGTSYYAALAACYMIESLARIPSTAELASEVRYANPLVEPDTLFFVISQSGETADTLFALRELKRKGARVLGVCNVVGSTIAREADGGIYIHAGPEIAVASTKAFTSTLTAFLLFALSMARSRDLSLKAGLALIDELSAVPGKIQSLLDRRQDLDLLAQKYLWAGNFLYLGRGINYPLALEGALKLKEISYIHAEGTSSAEMKHGPIALINESFPTVMILPQDSLRGKNISNLKEIKARQGKVIALATAGDEEISSLADDVFFIPPAEELLNPLLAAVPLQLFAYYLARRLGRNVDQPRNLAKSVTVE